MRYIIILLALSKLALASPTVADVNDVSYRLARSQVRTQETVDVVDDWFRLYDENQRLKQTIVELEFYVELLLKLHGDPLSPDLNGDGIVNGNDLVIMAAAWLKEE